MNPAIASILAYIAAVSLLSVIITVWDKRVSKIEGMRRVPEKTLMFLAAAGGSIAMYLAMLTVRHKTKHPKFMVGIPAIIIAQYGAVFLVYNLMK